MPISPQGISLLIVMKFPETMIKISLIFVVIMAGVWCVMAFASGSWVFGAIGLLFFAISVCYAKAGKFAKSMSRVHTHLIYLFIFVLTCVWIYIIANLLFFSLASNPICSLQHDNSNRRHQSQLWSCTICLFVPYSRNILDCCLGNCIYRSTRQRLR